MKLTGAHVLITGASRGIGAGLARAFHSEGARVTLVARTEAPLRALAEELGGTAIHGNLLERTFRIGLVRAAEEATGRSLDILVNNAGIAAAGSVTAAAPETLEHLFALNSLVPAELCRQALPGMVERSRGHIVNISSLAGCGALPGLAAYSASKAALTQFTAGLRADLRGLPITTTLVEVGLVRPTAMADEVTTYPPTEAAFARLHGLRILADTPLERLCTATVRAVAADRRHVRLPRRTFFLSAVPESIRRSTELLLSGVPPRLG